MTDDRERYRRALERIQGFKPEEPIDEWSEAAAFLDVQLIAMEALDPSARETRLEHEQSERSRLRRRVSALRRGGRYYVDGAWVRFLKGDGDRLGLVHVKVLERVGESEIWIPGTHHVVHVDKLQASPGVPL